MVCRMHSIARELLENSCIAGGDADGGPRPSHRYTTGVTGPDIKLAERRCTGSMTTRRCGVEMIIRLRDRN